MRTVAEAMTAPPVVVEPSTTIQVTSARMLDARAQVAVITVGGRVCGLATAEDIARALAEGHDATETPVGMIAERDPPAAHSEEPLAEAHQRMRSEGHTVLPVVSSEGEPIGVLHDDEAGG